MVDQEERFENTEGQVGKKTGEVDKAVEEATAGKDDLVKAQRAAMFNQKDPDRPPTDTTNNFGRMEITGDDGSVLVKGAKAIAQMVEQSEGKMAAALMSKGDISSLTDQEKREMGVYLTKNFDKIDKDGDGHLSPDELRKHLEDVKYSDPSSPEADLARKIEAHYNKIRNVHDDRGLDWEISRRDCEELAKVGGETGKAMTSAADQIRDSLSVGSLERAVQGVAQVTDDIRRQLADFGNEKMGQLGMGIGGMADATMKMGDLSGAEAKERRQGENREQYVDRLFGRPGNLKEEKVLFETIQTNMDIDWKGLAKEADGIDPKDYEQWKKDNAEKLKAAAGDKGYLTPDEMAQMIKSSDDPVMKAMLVKMMLDETKQQTPPLAGTGGGAFYGVSV